ncbi:MAG TPA: ACT domain-containing protein [Phycisphaerae bacterium]|nr:ACT domain-containing protein [Phycisphaerae bacterium]
MSGQTDLPKLLRALKPVLREGEFVFCSIRPEEAAGLRGEPIFQFLEDEGLTVVLRREEAEQNGLAFAFPSRMLTLTAHSSLDAVGVLAAVTMKLADAGISVNAVSACYHDHLFVPSGRAEEALRLLAEMSG